MTTEGLENIKAVLRKAIELQVNATLVMATLQSIYLDEEGGLDQDTESSLLSAIDLAKWLINHTVTTTKAIQKAFDTEKSLADLDKQLESIQDNDTARTN